MQIDKELSPTDRKNAKYHQCWLWGADKREYCAICKQGDEAAWRKRCDAERAARGFDSYAVVLAKLQKAIG
jgi:hypothetical protein